MKSKGNKGFAFGNGIMSYADGTGEGPSQAEGPSPEGPLAIWHKPQLALEVGLDRYLTASRGLCPASRNMRKKLSGAFFGLLGNLANSDRNAHTALSRGHAVNHGHTPSRTYSDSEIPCRPNDESKNRPGGSHFVWAQPEQIFDRMVRAARYS